MKILLKPTAMKIFLAIVLFAISSWVWRIYVMSAISDTFPLGFPLQFFLSWGPCRPGQSCSEFNGWHLTLDVIVWYIIGSILVQQIQKK
jgi:hypothetical protein